MTDFLVKNKLEQIVENFKVSEALYADVIKSYIVHKIVQRSISIKR